MKINKLARLFTLWIRSLKILDFRRRFTIQTKSLQRLKRSLITNPWTTLTKMAIWTMKKLTTVKTTNNMTTIPSHIWREQVFHWRQQAPFSSRIVLISCLEQVLLHHKKQMLLRQSLNTKKEADLSGEMRKLTCFNTFCMTTL